MKYQPFGPKHETDQDAAHWITKGLGLGMLRAWGFEPTKDEVDETVTDMAINIAYDDVNHAINTDRLRLGQDQQGQGQWQWQLGNFRSWWVEPT